MTGIRPSRREAPPAAPPELAGRRALVVGLARSGAAAARLLLRHGAEVAVADRKSRADLEALAAPLEADGVRLYAGDPGFEALDGRDLVVISPGVPPSVPLVAEARRRGLPVTGEIELAASFARAPLVAVTGTNGKSTTVTLIAWLLEALGIRAVLAGNVGTALAGVVEEAPADAVLVVEVSSFQLETAERFRPRVGVVLNLAPDHLDRYPSAEEYYGAKKRLFIAQTGEDAAVLNAADARLMTWADGLAAQVYTFGSGPHGVTVSGGDIELVQGDRRTRITAARDLGVPGPHNVANALAALTAVHALGEDVADPRIREALSRFRGLEHRIEYAGELNGVRFYNDSKATNTDSLAVALESFEEPIVLIAGGRDKNGDFESLAEKVRGRVPVVVAIGEAAAKIRRSWSDVVPEWVEAGTSFERAVEAAYQEAGARGGVVLLSPGCASFDMFRDYEDRGRRFKALVSALGAERRTR